MQSKLLRAFALLNFFACGSAAADGFALGVKAGTLGLGVEATAGLSERLNVRLGVNDYSYSFDETASDIRYDTDLDLSSAALLLDWHPFAGTFRLSAGLVRNKNALHMTATPTSAQNIGGQVFQPSDIGTLRGDVTFKKNVPYAGIGWGNAVRGKGFGASFEIGVLFQDQPDVALRSEGGALSDDADFQARLRAEEEEAEADLEDFDVYPVVSLGLSYRF